MEIENMTSSQENAMSNIEVKVSRTTFGVLFLLLNLYPLYLALNAFTWIPKQEQMLREMDLGKPPGISSVVFEVHPFLWLLPLVSISLTVAAMASRSSKPALPAAAVLATFGVTYLLLVLLSEAATGPVLYIIERINAPPPRPW